jgi:hypothetical protein
MPPKSKADKPKLDKSKTDEIKTVSSKSENPMMYCVKCKSKKECKKSEIKLSQSSKGTNMAQGPCVTCGTKMSTFIGKDKVADFK